LSFIHTEKSPGVGCSVNGASSSWKGKKEKKKVVLGASMYDPPPGVRQHYLLFFFSTPSSTWFVFGESDPAGHDVSRIKLPSVHGLEAARLPSSAIAEDESDNQRQTGPPTHREGDDFSNDT